MMGTYFPPDNINATYPISVTIVDKLAAAVQGEIWIKVRKNSGYYGKIETTQFGALDNELVYGS